MRKFIPNREKSPFMFQRNQDCGLKNDSPVIEGMKYSRVTRTHFEEVTQNWVCNTMDAGNDGLEKTADLENRWVLPANFDQPMLVSWRRED